MTNPEEYQNLLEENCTLTEERDSYKYIVEKVIFLRQSERRGRPGDIEIARKSLEFALRNMPAWMKEQLPEID